MGIVFIIEWMSGASYVAADRFNVSYVDLQNVQRARNLLRLASLLPLLRASGVYAEGAIALGSVKGLDPRKMLGPV